MRIKFTRDCELVKKYNICCFSGDSQQEVVAFKAGQTLEIDDYEIGEKRRHQPKLCIIYLKGEGDLHPDRFENVPQDLFEEVISEPVGLIHDFLMDGFRSNLPIQCSGHYLGAEAYLPTIDSIYKGLGVPPESHGGSG
jgi:hypothetical protein